MEPEIKYVFEVPHVPVDIYGNSMRPATQKDINNLYCNADSMIRFYEFLVGHLDGMHINGFVFRMKHHAWCKENNVNPFRMSDSERTQFVLTFGDDLQA